MKILLIAPYLYEPKFSEHSKNKSGFGIMVNDIASEVGKGGNEVIFAAHAFGPERKTENFTIAKNTLWKNIFHGRYRGILKFVSNMSKKHVSAKACVREAFYYLHLGHLEHLIKKEKPDIVHIHGCTNVIFEIMEICQKHNTPFAITLHGLLEDDAGAGKVLKHCECRLIKHCEANSIPITVISTRMKERLMLPYYGAESSSNVAVITNGIDVQTQDATVDLKKKLNIAEHKKVVLAVGSVCELKNQKQMVRAFARLPERTRENAAMVLVGTQHDGYDIAAEIKNCNVEDQVFCSDFVPREELKNFYSVADITLNASITEGFGLPIVEGFVYGVPAVAFADIDAISDVYHEDVMLLCNERSDNSLALTIDAALNKEWKKDAIKVYAERFSLKEMAEKYNAIYAAVIEK